MANVDTIFVISNPVKTARLYYVLKPFLDEKLKSKKKVLNKILEKSKEKEEIGYRTLQKYYEYAKIFLENLHRLKGKRIVFLNGVSPDLMSIGVPGRSGRDPFSHLYGISEEIIKIASEIFESEKGEAQEKIKEYLKDRFVFWPIAPIDFPFYVDGYVARHVFANEVAELSKRLELEGRVGFGSLEKRLNDVEEKVGNYEFKEWLFDSKRLKKALDDNPTMFIVERQKMGDKFERWISDCISFNRWLMIEKYKRILKELEIKKATIYAIKTSYAAEIFEKVCKESGIELDAILRAKKEITAFRERDPTYLNQLKGRIVSWINDDLKIFVKPHIFVRKAFGKEIKFVSCHAYPFFRCERGSNCHEIGQCTAGFIQQFLPKEKISLLADDARRCNYSAIPIEGAIYLQNIREFEEIADTKLRTSTIKERDLRFGKRKFVPFVPKKSTFVKSYDLRASDFKERCAISRILNKVNKASFPIALDTRAADVGIALHWIENQQPREWGSFVHNGLLAEIGITPIRRSEYCERTYVYEFEGVQIVGHPDCALLLEGSDDSARDVAIIDIKHRMHTAYETEGYLDQALIYALAVDQTEQLNARSFYLTIAETPFEQTRLMRANVVPTEAYRMPRYSKKIVRAGSYEIDELHKKILAFKQKEQILLHDKKQLAAERERMEAAGLCSAKRKCFDKPLCDFLLAQAQTAPLIDLLPKPYPQKIHRSTWEK